MYKCPNCGGELAFSPKDQKLVCSFCDSSFNPDFFDDKRNTITSEDTITGTVFTCPQCGAELFSTEETAATFCSFCGSSVLLKSRISNERRPDMIIPFRISKEQCADIYQGKIKRSWFIPGSMKKQENIEKFRGIYMPFWSYNASGISNMENKHSTKTTLEGNYDVTREYSVNMNADCHIDGILYDASSTFPDDVSEYIQPYSVKKQGKPFKPAYLSGFYADTGDIPPEIYEQDAVESAQRIMKSEIDSRLNKYGASVSEEDIQMDHASPSFLYLPVWFLSSRNKKTGRVSYAVVNGETGRISADLPIDFKRYLLIALLIAVPAFFLYTIPVLLPKTLVWIVFAILFIILFLVNSGFDKAYVRDHGGEDKGQQYKNPEVAGNVKVKVTKNLKRKEKLFFWGWFIIHCLFRTAGMVGISILFRGKIVLGICLILACVLYVICMRTLRDKEMFEIVKPRRYSAPFSAKFPTLLKPLFGMLVCLVISIWAPAHDAWYYGAAVFSICMLCLSVLDLVRYHNILTSRKPFQLEKRGGDENA